MGYLVPPYTSLICVSEEASLPSQSRWQTLAMVNPVVAFTKVVFYVYISLYQPSTNMCLYTVRHTDT